MPYRFHRAKLITACAWLCLPSALAAQSMSVTMCGQTTMNPLPQSAVYNGTGGAQCHGQNISPPLCWHSAPPATSAFAVIMYDSTADFYHWGLTGLAATAHSLPANAGSTGSDLGTNLRNDFGHSRYDGPCPPPGPAHLYHFQLYALDTKITAATAADLAKAIKPHILQSAEITGSYASPPGSQTKK